MSGTMDRDADVVVVGAGIVGCAAAYYLARRGERAVVVVDGKTSLDISAFRFSRFAEGAIGKPRNVL
ncbi:MAG TPA: FAD-dependent oxidoreductase [Gemmatimonadales bacterium]|nr:FAD-dependent oxidoreductase [Gemmatimonadales bacterium]